MVVTVVVVVVVVVVTVLKTYSAQELPAVGGFHCFGPAICVGVFPQLSQLFSEVTPTIALVCPNDLVSLVAICGGSGGADFVVACVWTYGSFRCFAT